MKPLKERISITIDADLLEKLRFQAEYDDRSLSQYINLVLKEHVKNSNNTKWVFDYKRLIFIVIKIISI